ncbi:mug138 [Symbiodinium pilosum]|uniref:Mug138 protein n=1 Tax=Symbiodinium pilosum TaxID=2952 RepID=A0A812Y4Q7_SYMPI|nr:mug138 [Symbiodinium pilosum]
MPEESKDEKEATSRCNWKYNVQVTVLMWCSTCAHVRMNMFSTDRSLPAPSLFASLPPLYLSRRFDDMASTPVSSIASSATNVADVLASLGNDELAAEVGSWSAELQAKVVAAVSALSSTSTSTSASTVVRRRKSNKLDAASSSTAASWLAPAVEPADLSAELTAIQEGERSLAATTIADDEVINFGAMQTPLGNARRRGGLQRRYRYNRCAPSTRLSATYFGCGSGVHRAGRPAGGFMPKHAVINKFREVLQAAGVELTYVDPNGRQLFGGHAAGTPARLLAFGHDMLNAYWQWPVRWPEHGATFLPTAAGVTLWAGDAVQLVVRALLADSAFETFGGIFGDLGLQTKPSKAQPPANEQVIRPRPPRTDANLTPKLVRRRSWITFSPTQATIFADAFFVDRGRQIKAGHVPDDAGRHRSQRRRNGWGYVVQIGDQVFYDFGEAPAWSWPSPPSPPGCRRSGRLTSITSPASAPWGYGNNGAVNGMVAAMWGLAAAQAWAPHFERMPSADNISDALSRGDEGEAQRRRWTRVHTRQDEILQILYQAGASTQYATASAVPVLLKGTEPMTCVFHKQDDRFKQPKARVSFSIYSPFFTQDPMSYTKSELWCRCVEEALQEYAYDAEVAGVKYSLSLGSACLRLVLIGYNDKLHVLLDAVTAKMMSMVEVPEQIFSIVSDGMGDDLRNQAFHSPPYLQSNMRMDELLTTGMSFPAYKRLEAFEQIKCSDLKGLVEQFFASGAHVESLMLGNLTADDARLLCSKLTTGLGLRKALPVLPTRAEAILPEGATLWELDSTDDEDPNHAVFMKIQLKSGLDSEMLTKLLDKAISTKFFDLLRTQQQLGYIVALMSSAPLVAPNLLAFVQTEFNPSYVRGCIEKFLDEHFDFVEERMAEEEFETCKAGLLAELRQKPEDLTQEAQRYGRIFLDRTFEFDRREKCIRFIESSTLAMLRSFVRDEMRKAPRMYVQVKKLLDKEDKPLPDGAVIPEPENFRRWNTHVEAVKSFASTAKWNPLNSSVDVAARL